MRPLAEKVHGNDPSFTIAFQPIVDVACCEIFAHEGLVRDPNGERAKQFPIDRLMFEITAGERVVYTPGLAASFPARRRED